MPNFEKLKISLTRPPQGELLKASGYEEATLDRPAFLAAAFEDNRQFLHGKSRGRFSFSPLAMPSGYAGGFFKRERPVILHKDDLAPYEAENYEGALAIVSLAHEQHAWVERNQQVAAPKPLLESYFGYLLNNTDLRDFEAVVRYVDTEQEYWSVVRQRRRDIARLSFTFIPPNPMGADDAIHQLVQAVQNESHPDTQEHTYRAAPGQMDPEAPHLEASARIAMEGGGEAEVRDGKGKLLYSSNSQKARTVEEVPEQDMPTPEQPTFVKRVIDRLFGT